MEKTEALLVIGGYGNCVAIPVSKAHEILPHLRYIHAAYESGEHVFRPAEERMVLTLLSAEDATAMYVVDKITGD